MRGERHRVSPHALNAKVADKGGTRAASSCSAAFYAHESHERRAIVSRAGSRRRGEAEAVEETLPVRWQGGGHL